MTNRYKDLPEATKQRLVVENDDVSFSHADTMRIHEVTGCPVIFDNLHHFCRNPEGVSMRHALKAALGTWREGVVPKIHYSSPTTAFEVVETKETGNTGRAKTVEKWKAPPTKAHSDFINPMEFALFWETVEADKLRTFDIMLEAKAKDVALLKLRKDIRRQIEFGAIRPLNGF